MTWATTPNEPVNLLSWYPVTVVHVTSATAGALMGMAAPTLMVSNVPTQPSMLVLVSTPKPTVSLVVNAPAMTAPVHMTLGSAVIVFGALASVMPVIAAMPKPTVSLTVVAPVNSVRAAILTATLSVVNNPAPKTRTSQFNVAIQRSSTI